MSIHIWIRRLDFPHWGMLNLSPAQFEGASTFGQAHIDRQPMARYQGKEAGNISGNHPNRHWRVDFMQWHALASVGRDGPNFRGISLDASPHQG
jgi:hypothetical protein